MLEEELQGEGKRESSETWIHIKEGRGWGKVSVKTKSNLFLLLFELEKNGLFKVIRVARLTRCWVMIACE